MVKSKIVETVYRYDKDGNLIEKTVREETSEDDTDYNNHNYGSYSINDNLDQYITLTSTE